ncbi:MAG: ribose-phosphate pyrophosphokinase [Hydrogenophilaceae bacterium]|jgi:ribose-phosphate pyrophosphokinase|nr:ribose-phosphate pyrophosphokinase [Hydrogenophilaceae bacterium]
MKLVSGNANPTLARDVAKHLKRLRPKAKDFTHASAEFKRFKDNEIFVRIDENVRGEDVFILQSTSYPANDNLMELLIGIDALRRASARRITAVMPYYGYARQDRKVGGRTPISAKLVANLIVAAGAHRVLTLELHAGQIQGFFDIPVDNLFSTPILEEDLRANFGEKLDEMMIVSPDVGGVIRARALANRFGADLAIVDKRRPEAGVSEVMHIIGDVKGRRCVLVDDIVDSAGTLCNAAVALKEAGAKDVSAYVTHGVLSNGAVDRVEKSELKELVVTDSIDPEQRKGNGKKIRTITVAPLIAEAIDRIANEQSISVLFEP